MHQGVWGLDMLREQSTQEWAMIENAAEHYCDAETLQQGKATWEKALSSGDLFQFNPVFYALGRKT